jgi:hypothetical protein
LCRTLEKPPSQFHRVRAEGHLFLAWANDEQLRAAKMGFPLKRSANIISAFEFECFPDQTGAWFDLYDSQAG